MAKSNKVKALKGKALPAKPTFGDLLMIINTESARLACVAGIVKLIADVGNPEDDALYGALEILEDANQKISRAEMDLRRL